MDVDFPRLVIWIDCTGTAVGASVPVTSGGKGGKAVHLPAVYLAHSRAQLVVVAPFTGGSIVTVGVFREPFPDVSGGIHHVVLR